MASALVNFSSATLSYVMFRIPCRDPVEIAIRRLSKVARNAETTPKSMARAIQDTLDTWQTGADVADRIAGLRAGLIATMNETGLIRGAAMFQAAVDVLVKEEARRGPSP